MTADPISLPFQEAIDYFRQKVAMPTERWGDLIGAQHTRAWTVAGATTDALLSDFRASVDKAIAEGTTIEDFRKDFDEIVAKHGWSYNGSRNWRSRVIYETNVRTAYDAGRWKQMTDPDVLRYQPYWRYLHKEGEEHPRPEHLAWDGLILRADDPWWRTHTPRNAFGCNCSWEGVTRRELKALGKDGPDTAPPLDERKVPINTSWGPVEVSVPKGIGPGWGYSVGESAFGRQLPAAEMDAWRAMRADAWETLTPGDWRNEGCLERLPADTPTAKPGPKARDEVEAREMVKAAIGGDQMAIPTPDGGTILVDAAALAKHLDLARTPMVPLLPELLNDPAEIWIRFDRHKGTGKVVLRKRLVKIVEMQGEKGLCLVADAAGGMFGGWTFVPMNRLEYLNRQRVGRLLWSREWGEMGPQVDRPTRAPDGEPGARSRTPSSGRSIA